MILLRVLTFTLISLVTASFASPVEKRQALAEVITKCNNPNHVALTFDDGPWIYNGDLARILRDNGAKGTFFVNGMNWGCIYDVNLANQLKATYDMGHQIASHTWAHKNLATLTWDQIHDEMWRVEQAMSKILGAYPAMMRPPFGSYNNLVRQASYVRGQKIYNWDLDAGDSSNLSPGQSKAIYDARIALRPSNILALNHETKSSTVYDVIPYAIGRLKAAGYQLVTVAECTGHPAYQWVSTPTPRDGSWHC